MYKRIMSSVNFTLFNEFTKNNIAGITYLSNQAKNANDTPYHILLGHATGFCKEVYCDLVVELRKKGIHSPITAIDMMNHGDSTKDLAVDWRLCANDVYAVINKIVRPSDPNKILIGMGHSMGGTLMALVEATHPNTFGSLVLLEPILPGPPFERDVNSGLAQFTLKRKTVFPSLDVVRSIYSSKPPFSTWTKGSLDSYINHGFKKSSKDGKEVVELKLSKEQEAEFFRMGAAHGCSAEWPKLQLPILLLRGTSEFKERGDYDELAKKNKYTQVKEVKGGHFFPMDSPDVVAELTVEFLNKHVPSLASKL